MVWDKFIFLCFLNQFSLVIRLLIFWSCTQFLKARVNNSPGYIHVTAHKPHLQGYKINTFTETHLDGFEKCRHPISLTFIWRYHYLYFPTTDEMMKRELPMGLAPAPSDLPISLLCEFRKSSVVTDTSQQVWDWMSVSLTIYMFRPHPSSQTLSVLGFGGGAFGR